MDNKSKALIVCCMVIALLVGYIIGGGNKASADMAGGDVAILLEQLAQLEKNYTKFKEMTDNDKIQIDKNQAVLKAFAAAIGNEDLIKLASDSKKLNSIRDSEWYLIIRNRLSDILPGLKGKGVPKKNEPLDKIEEEMVSNTANMLRGDYKNAGLKNKTERQYGVMILNSEIVNNAVNRYLPTQIYNGEVKKAKTKTNKGVLSTYINDQQNTLNEITKELNKSKTEKASIITHFQILEQVFLMIADLNIELLKTQDDLLKIETLRHTYEFGGKLQKDLQKTF